jgi:ASC-1-like (ASCH) protein
MERLTAKELKSFATGLKKYSNFKKTRLFRAREPIENKIKDLVFLQEMTRKFYPDYPVWKI